MFNDRDLGVMGAGAVFSVLCLLLPLPFSWKVVVGALVLVGFMILALLRLGPDRIPPEEWARRRIRYRLQARRYTYQQANYQPSRHVEKSRIAGLWKQIIDWVRMGWARWGLKRDIPGPAVEQPDRQGVKAQLGDALPVTFDIEEVGLYPLATALLGVVGVYFLVWLLSGGGAELGILMEEFFS